MKHNKSTQRKKKLKKSIKRKRNYKKQKGGQQSLVEILKKYEGPTTFSLSLPTSLSTI